MTCKNVKQFPKMVYVYVYRTCVDWSDQDRAGVSFDFAQERNLSATVDEKNDMRNSK